MSKTNVLGYPRIGAMRELKKATEAYWKNELSKEQLLEAGAEIRKINWKKQQAAGIDFIPSNDFSFYDQVLDMTCLLGNVPSRFHWDGDSVDLETFFLIARGSTGEGHQDADSCGCGSSHQTEAIASEMTKWFDTNYHYIVPEFNEKTTFQLSADKIFSEFQEALDLGIKTKPVLIGPLTYLHLGKVQDATDAKFDRFSLLDSLLPIYVEILTKLQSQGAEYVQIDEPIASLDMTQELRAELREIYSLFSQAVPSLKIIFTTYFDETRENLSTLANLPVAGLHFDAVRGEAEVDAIVDQVPTDKLLSLGLVNGRNIWINDYAKSLKILKAAQAKFGDNLLVASSCSLVHSPVSLASEDQLNEELKAWMVFADEKLVEIKQLNDILNGDTSSLAANEAAIASRKASELIHKAEVKERAAAIKASDFERQSKFSERQKLQQAKLGLPAFPTTTIGSFPQTTQVRQARAAWRRGELSEADYDTFLKEETKKCIEYQDSIDIDMPVHGEFERTDMVEYFGEQLDGFTFTRFGWVQSYGTRCVKPPIIFGDVSRPEAMTVYWSKFAQTVTDRPMKGMLTGPITILQWSFVRDDQPRKDTTFQIALAIRDEVVDLETSGIAAIQIDEPAIREGLPLRRSDWAAYLEWAVNAFKLSAAGVKDDTQIHTHMCYAEFNDIITSIGDMDADVITIETSRSNMELLEAFVDFKYPNEIGPGVYDIHSPRVPKTEEMTKLMDKAVALLPKENLWVNPDCGLKTRGWEEVKTSLENMVISAKELRAKHA